MTRINTNINSLQAQRTLSRNNADLSTRLERLSTGLKINTGKDGPAALIASENMRSEMAGIRQAIDNSTRAANVLNTAEGSLAEINSLLLQMQSLTVEAANTGGLSPEEIEANQLQVDAIIGSIDRISNTTQFNGRALLDGSLDYETANLDKAEIADVRVNSATLPDNGSIGVDIRVNGAAAQATVTANAADLADDATIRLSGNKGVEQISFAAGTTVAQMVTAVNQFTATTGVTAVDDGGTLTLQSEGYGTKQFVGVEVLSEGPAGTLATDLGGDNVKVGGVDADVLVNGVEVETDGLTVNARSTGLDVTVELDAAFAADALGAAATVPVNSTFDITGGGTRFQIGSNVDRQSQVSVGIGSVSASRLGSNAVGYLSEIASGGANSLTSGNTTNAQEILEVALTEVASLRGRMGALQKNVLETNINSLQIALENVSAAESQIRDADFAQETAAMTRAQILAQANTSVLAQANNQPQQVLSLLQG